jgi:hypothetical protein
MTVEAYDNKAMWTSQIPLQSRKKSDREYLWSYGLFERLKRSSTEGGACVPAAMAFAFRRSARSFSNFARMAT